ncbi:SDR family oxidoreductase [Sphaerisporangium sp. NPDC051011]|uniref:SDR family NAD(P)-dependent oxidoreductase n=1 Tax=Sphaerisporangium sp. NPDC051011 TaxID=3155792 RepID=UPI0033F6124D
MSGDSGRDRPVVIVTGGTKGIGLATVEAFVRGGYDALLCSRNAAEAAAVADSLGREGARVIGVAADMADPDVGEQLVGACMGEFGRVDCVVNNAGVFARTPLTEMTAEAWDRTLHANLRGPVLLASAAARAMRQGAGTSIVNVASINALAAEADFAAYNASKAGMVSLTQTMAVEWAARGIRVNCVAPGWVRTPLSEPWIGGLSDSDIARMVPVERLGEPGEIADVISFLASPAAAYITGQTITVDGGMLARQPTL